ncbi:MAG: type VI secretion system tube protein Hcp [Saccharospirillum sp.]|nr:type VI secretion system tube protein Hcp [Saccharospirillum sp.]
MALPGYMQITAENQGAIEGDVDLAGREGSIEILNFQHTVKIPSDSFGIPTGRRVHLPMTIGKVVDRSSPMLFQALCDSELLTEVLIDWYRTDGSGMEELYYRLRLKNAQITNIEFYVPETSDAEHQVSGHREKVSLVYDHIIWSHEVDGVEYEDAWSAEG